MDGGDGDGAAEVPPARVAAHAALARRFLEVGVAQGDAEVVTGALAPAFRFHAPEGADDAVGALRASLEGPRPRLAIQRTVASGDLVLVHQCVAADGAPERSVYDLFRFDEAARIRDRWSLAQDVVPLADAANLHPHFRVPWTSSPASISTSSCTWSTCSESAR